MDMRKLVDAVKKHSEMNEPQIREAGERGAEAGWPGFTWTEDTVSFYEKNHELIWELLEESRETIGGDCVLTLLANFQQAKNVSSDAGFKNVLAWFALEEAGRFLEQHENTA